MEIAYRTSVRAVLAAILAWALLVVGASAQDITVKRIVIQGNQRVEQATILSYAGVRTGQTLSPAQINAAGQNLRNSGLFETVDVSTSGNTLIIKVVELPTINRISIEGNKKLDDKTLMKLVQSEPRRVFSAQQARADADAIANAYAQQGREATTVEPKIIRRSENRVDLVFEVNEGRTVELQRITIVGNRAFSDNRLKRVLATKQAGILSGVFKNDTFLADRVAYDKQLLTDFYHSRGYIDFEVTSASAQLSRARDAYRLTFNVREGLKYRFGKITVSSQVPELDPAEFQKVVKLRPGVTYAPSLVDGTVTRLENLATRKALNFIKVEPKVTRNERTQTLDIDFVLKRGPRVFIERIDIEGNTTTLDRVVRREFRVAEGDPYNPREISQALDRIRALGYFKSADATTRQGTTPDRVIITVKVVEQPTGSLSFGASYSADAGLGALISFSEKNFLGRGQSVSLSINTTGSTKTYTGSFTEPYFLGRNVSFSANLNLGSTNSNATSFRTLKRGGSVALGFPVSEYGRASVSYGLSRDSVSNVPTTASQILQREEGTLTTSTVGYGYSFDTRNRGLDPTRGVLLKLRQDVAGLGGDNKYVKSSAFLGGEMKVLNEEVTLKAVTEVGALKMLSGNSRVTDRYLASSRYVRGFQFNGYGPRDLNAANNDALGGNYYASARVEADFPLGIPEEFGLSGAVFADLGSVWGLDNTNGGDVLMAGGPQVDDSLYWRSSVGFALLWKTPIGPLRLNFPHAVLKKPYDRTSTFELTVQSDF